MAIHALSYIGVNSDKIEDWSNYSEKCLGMQRVDRAKGTLSFRMDDQKQRLAITGDTCLLYTSPSPRDRTRSRMPSSA